MPSEVVRIVINTPKQFDVLFVSYDEQGRLDGVKNRGHNDVMIQYVKEGSGIKYNKPVGFTGKRDAVCDARYAYLPDYDIYIPIYLFIRPLEEPTDAESAE